MNTPLVVLSVWTSGMLLFFCEFAGALCFSPWVFRIGLRVWRESRRLPVPTMAAFETPTATFEVVGPGLCLFRPKMEWFSFGFRTRSLIKGTLRWEGDQATVEARLFLFPLLFACCTLAGGITWILTTDYQEEQVAGAVFLLVMGMVFSGIYLSMIPSEIRRAREILSEYEALVTPPSESKSVDEFGQIHRADDSSGPGEPVSRP